MSHYDAVRQRMSRFFPRRGKRPPRPCPDGPNRGPATHRVVASSDGQSSGSAEPPRSSVPRLFLTRSASGGREGLSGAFQHLRGGNRCHPLQHSPPAALLDHQTRALPAARSTRWSRRRLRRVSISTSRPAPASGGSTGPRVDRIVTSCKQHGKRALEESVEPIRIEPGSLA